MNSRIRYDETLGDEVLVERARSGSRDAFSTLTARHGERIHRLAARMCRNASDADDVTQETFLRAQRGLGSFHGESSFGTWLHSIAVNEVLVRRRAAGRHPTELDPGLVSRISDAGESLAERANDRIDREVLAKRLHEAIDQLEEPQRAALVLCDINERTAKEAAAVLGVSAQAVRQRAHRARSRLRKLLADLRPEVA